MQTATDLTQVISYAFDVSHYSDGWITPFGRAVAKAPYEAAVWKPTPGTASIAELTAHAFNYLNRLNQDLSGEKRFSFEDWPEGVSSKEEWEGLKVQVKAVETQVREQLEHLDSEWLLAPIPRGKDPLYEHVLDIVVHDAYHAGQVVKLMQLWKEKS